MKNPEFHELLEKMKQTHDAKSHDYADDSNVFSNFEYAANIAEVTVDQVFLVLIGVKIARLQQLLKGKEPKNESLNDTFLDLANYCAIWGSMNIKMNNDKLVEDAVCICGHTPTGHGEKSKCMFCECQHFNKTLIRISK